MYKRQDLYNIDPTDENGKIYFGELTFTSLGGFMNYFTPDFLKKVGSLSVSYTHLDVYKRQVFAVFGCNTFDVGNGICTAILVRIQHSGNHSLLQTLYYIYDCFDFT